jgi:hypothetical protein
VPLWNVKANKLFADSRAGLNRDFMRSRDAYVAELKKDVTEAEDNAQVVLTAKRALSEKLNRNRRVLQKGVRVIHSIRLADKGSSIGAMQQVLDHIDEFESATAPPIDPDTKRIKEPVFMREEERLSRHPD